MTEILDRIRKLLAKADSSRTMGELHEAEALTAKATEMLTRHNLSMADVTAEERGAVREELWTPTDYGFPLKLKAILWERYLAAVVAENNFCKTLSCADSNHIWFVGREENRKVAVHIFVMIRRALGSACDELYHAEYQRLYRLGPIYAKEKMWNWRESFRIGSVERINERLQALRTEIDAETEGKLSAVIHLSGAEIDTFIGALDLPVAKFETEPLNPSAIRQGRAFADSLALSHAVEGSREQAEKARLLH